MNAGGGATPGSSADCNTPATRTRLYAPPAAGAARLRVLLVAPPKIPAWLAGFIQMAKDIRRLELDVLCVDGLDLTAQRLRLPLDLVAFLALDRLRWRRPSAWTLVPPGDNATELGQMPASTLAAAVAARKPELVLLAGGDRELAAHLAGVARSGCWRLHPNLIDRHVAGVDLLAATLRGDVVTAVELELATDGEAPRELVHSIGATHAGSHATQREEAGRKLPALLLRALRRVAGGELDLPAHRAADVRLRPAPEIARFGAGLRALPVALRQSLAWRWEQWQGEAPWFLTLRAGIPLDPAAPRPGPMTSIVAPAGRYWADPCAVEDGGRHLVFVEEFDHRGDKGIIACLELDHGGARRVGIVLDEPFHLSYPQVFQWQGAWYLTVESAMARRVSLYRASAFPLCWDRVTDLLSDCVCVDPTLHFHDGCWYLFGNVSESGGSTCDELFLFVAEALEGPYRPHPANPIAVDVRRARPAGRLFRRDGRLIRPAQDCSREYGSAIVFNEILELSPDRFRERELSRIEPDRALHLRGCHTYSADGIEILDARGAPPADAVTAMTGIGTESAQAHPLVSAIMPVYNGERFLAEAIDSALAQTWPNLEIIVVDDGSRDGSGALADRYAGAHAGRVRVIHQENRGLPLARNAAIAAARGRYLALLDADDVWLPHHIERCVAVLEDDSSVGLVHANTEDIDGAGRHLGMQSARWTGTRLDAYREVFLRRQHVSCPTAVFRRSIVATVGAFDAAFNRLGCEDRDMWLRIASATSLVYLDEVQALYRIHGNNMSANRERMWQARRLLVDKHAVCARGRALRRRALAAIDADRGHELAMEAPARPALAAFVHALARDPMRIDAWKGLLRRILVGRRPAAVVRP